MQQPNKNMLQFAVRKRVKLSAAAHFLRGTTIAFRKVIESYEKKLDHFAVGRIDYYHFNLQCASAATDRNGEKPIRSEPTGWSHSSVHECAAVYQPTAFHEQGATVYQPTALYKPGASVHQSTTVYKPRAAIHQRATFHESGAAVYQSATVPTSQLSLHKPGT
jgi:hypothetical protein